MKHFLLITFFVQFGGLFLLTKLWPQGMHRSFSQHAAANRISISYYIVLFGTTLPFIILFFVKWFTPHFDFPHLLNWLVITASLLQLACTLVPEIGGLWTLWHWIFAMSGAVILVPALAVIALLNDIPILFLLLCLACIIAMLYLLFFCLL